MKKILIIFLVFLLSTLISWGQIEKWTFQGQIVTFQANAVIYDTSAIDTVILYLIGDGIEIGDGIKIGDGVFLLDIIHPEQYMKEEETLNELIS